MPKKQHVVLVEDDDILADFLIKRLTLEEFEATRYARGLEAVTGILATGADLILLDISLPDIDGFEVLKRLKTSPTASLIPVIIVSNFSQERDIAWGKELGVKQFINKASVTPVDIVNAVHEVLDAQEK